MTGIGRPLSAAAEALSPAEVRSIIADAIRPGNFFVGPALDLTWETGPEEVFWELYRGHALDHTKTRSKRTFEAWNIIERGADEALLSVRFAPHKNEIHVTRSILCRTWEAYVENGQALSRETNRRVRELVGTIGVTRFPSGAEILGELIVLLKLAVVGTSRLPLTSLEAPLPQFSLGQIAFGYDSAAGKLPLRSGAECVKAWCRSSSEAREMSRLLESSIRATPISGISELADCWAANLRHDHRDGRRLIDCFSQMYNDVALSPYTDFVAKSLQLLDRFVDRSLVTQSERIDFLTRTLRLLSRHLTSFDLVRFHHRGANYPDALMLEEILEATGRFVQQQPQLFLTASVDSPAELHAKRLRRRGIRQAALIQREYRGYPVPDLPTSPGENARVLPAPFIRIEDEQITDVGKRRRRLFELNGLFDDPSAELRQVVQQSITDLAAPAELMELGTGLFLDRPLGWAKAIGEPDATPMLSHEAFSPSIARTRLQRLREFNSALDHAIGEPRGIRWQSRDARRRPGVVSVHDAHEAAEDFVFLRTTRSSVREFFEQYDFEANDLGAIFGFMRTERCLILPSPEDGSELRLFNASYELRARLKMDASAGYDTRGGSDYLAAGLIVIEARDPFGAVIAGAIGRRVLPRLHFGAIISQVPQT